MTPLERAARAIAAIDYRKGVRDCERPNEPPIYTPIAWDSLPAKAQLESTEKARAVLEAIREPSEGMETAVAKAIQDTLPLDSGTDPPDVSVMVDYGVSKAAVGAMIDAALAEGA